MGDPQTAVKALCTPDHPVKGGLGLATDKAAEESLRRGGAMPLGKKPADAPALRHADPKAALSSLLEALRPPAATVAPGSHALAVVDPTARCHPGAAIGPFAPS